jgi:predicted Holliday junction resolvase-like endonuclease
METVSFAFGVLSMVGLLLVITIVAGAVKVLKQQKQIKGLEQWLSDFQRDVSQEINKREEELRRDTDQRMDHIHRVIDEVSNHVDKSYSESISYTDSRLDKLESKLTTDKLASGLKPERVKELIQG